MFEKRKITAILCSTGCTCCHHENHFRGPYRTREDAERRIAYFRSPESGPPILASQYSRRGNFKIYEYEMEVLPDGRAIIDSEVFAVVPEFIDVDANGAADEGAERMELEAW